MFWIQFHWSFFHTSCTSVLFLQIAFSAFWVWILWNAFVDYATEYFTSFFILASFLVVGLSHMAIHRQSVNWILKGVVWKGEAFWDVFIWRSTQSGFGKAAELPQGQVPWYLVQVTTMWQRKSPSLLVLCEGVMLMVKCLVSLFIDLISAINSMDLPDIFSGTLHYDLKLFWEFEWSMYFWRPSSHVGRCISPKVMFGAVVGWWFQSFQWGTDHKGFCFLQVTQTISTNSAHSGKKRCCSHTWPRRTSDVAMETQVIENAWPK